MLHDRPSLERKPSPQPYEGATAAPPKSATLSTAIDEILHYIDLMTTRIDLAASKMASAEKCPQPDGTRPAMGLMDAAQQAATQIEQQLQHLCRLFDSIGI